MDALLEQQPDAPHFPEFGGHQQCIVEPGRLQKIDLDRSHHEDDPVARAQLVLLESQRAQPLRPSPFEKFQVVPVVNDTAGIGVFVVNADRPDKTGWLAIPQRLLQNKSSCEPAILGGSRPKCR